MKARIKNTGDESAAESQRGDSAHMRVDSATSKHVAPATSKHVAPATSKHVAPATSKHIDSATSKHIDSATSKHIDSATSKHIDSATSKHVDSATSRKFFGLIGNPIDHSLSPQLFAQAHPDSPDVYDLIHTPDFEEAYSIFLNRYDAVNVTSPFKELAFQRADSHEASCSIIGAANLLIKENGQVKAYNTDMTAVMKCLWRGVVHQINSEIWTPERATGEIRALVIGAGGAGKAAAIACLNLGFKTSITNRTRPRTFDFIDRISAYRKNLPEAVDFLDLSRAIAQADIIVYTIPALPVHNLAPNPGPSSTINPTSNPVSASIPASPSVFHSPSLSPSPSPSPSLSPSPSPSLSPSLSPSPSPSPSFPPSADLLRSDLSGKIILEASYHIQSISPSLLPQTALYIDGKQWLREQALATWRLL